MLLCVFPPFVEGTVVLSIKYLVVESQTETGTCQSERPNFGVLTMATYLAVMPLTCKVRGDL
jgi:hypothetical protein